jgi:hypothetical protein
MQAKLDQDGFNEMPGREQVINELTRLHILEQFEVADAKHKYWQNESDTLVLKYNTSAPSLVWSQGMDLAKAAARLGADEIDYMHEDYELYVRIWWD